MQDEIGAYEAKTKLPEILRRVAIREGVPLASLDKDLLKVIRKANVGAYLK